MSQYFETGVVPETSAGAVAAHLRVKTFGAVAAAGALDQSIGTMDSPCVAAGPCSVRLKTAQGTRKMVAAAAIAKNAYVYGAAGGKISSVANGNLEGIAREAAAADGDVIEVEHLNQVNANGVTLASASGAITIAP